MKEKALGKGHSTGIDNLTKGKPPYLAVWNLVVWGTLALLICARFVYLQADFPANLGPYGYTDEGWWSRNAVAWVREGSWYIDDGYNTMTSLPVLPLLQVVWFKLFGVSLVSVRAISVVSSLVVSVWVYLLARREISAQLAWIAPFVVLANYPTFAYSRSAFLEMPLLAFVLGSLWLATRQRSHWFTRVVISGLVFTAAILTKTTALFALPVIFFSLYFQGPSPQRSRQPLSSPAPSNQHQTRPLTEDSVAKKSNGFWEQTISWAQLPLLWLLVVGMSLGLCHLVLNQLADPQSQAYFSTYNVTAKVPRSLFAFVKAPLRVLERSFVLFPFLFPGLLGAIALLQINKKQFRKRQAATRPVAQEGQDSPLFRIIMLWTATSLGMFSLSDFTAPRYMLVLIVPIALAIPLWIQSTLRLQKVRRPQKKLNGSGIHALSKYRPWVNAGLGTLFATALVVNLFQVGHSLWFAQFELVETAEVIEEYIEATATESKVVMGTVADTIALATDSIKAINDWQGYRSIDHRIQTFNPGYYLAFNPRGSVDEKKYSRIEEALSKSYRLVLIRRFDLYKNHAANRPIFFYKLEPKA